MKDLSVVILSYNTLDLTKQTLDSLIAALAQSKLQTEIILVDNASSDGSIDMLQAFQKLPRKPHIEFILVENRENVGYPKGNNQGIRLAQGKYVLLLNSDVILENVNFDQLIHYMEENSQVGGLAIKLMLTTGTIDPASHRGFPTPWNSFTYFSKLEKVFGQVPVVNKLVGGYHLTHLKLNTIHEIDSPNGAFFLLRSDVLKQINGFDEDFFMYGEDLDLSFRIKEAGYKIIYYPLCSALHLKHQSGLKGKNAAVRAKTKENFYEAMKIFYKKHYQNKYPSLIKAIVFWFIDFKKKHS